MLRAPAEPAAPESHGQRWAFALLLILTGLAMGVSGMPSPLYGVYEQTWDLSPFATTVVFAVYACAALGAVLVSGRISDAVGRKPVLLAALLALIVGLVLFLLADDIVLLLVARIIHGAAVGSIVVAASAALLDLRPEHGMRSGQLSGISFNIGLMVAVLITAAFAQYAPHPLRTPYAVIAVVCAIVGVGVLGLRETHTTRAGGPVRIAKPAVPSVIRRDFWFAALGAMASWSVFGVLMSLFPALAAQQARVDNLLFGGGVVGTVALAAAVTQWSTTRMPAHRAAIVGDVGLAVTLLVAIPAMALQSWPAVFVTAALLGSTFGLAFGGSLRHLSHGVPRGQRGETMSAFYVLAYLAMTVPTLMAGWASTRWSLTAAFPWFAALNALVCLAAAALGVVTMRKQASR